MFLNILLLELVSSNFLKYETVYELAKMSNNVYYNIGSKYWLNTTLDIVENRTVENDNVRSYSFTNSARDKVVVAFKGTSIYWTNSENVQNTSVLGKNGLSDVLSNQYETCTLSTSTNDKYNDNLFFSCCFYKQSSLFKVCDGCQELEKSECCNKCYGSSLDYEKNYINMVRKIVDSVKIDYDFDKVDVYFTGHSLGGILASFASIIYNKPAVTFETPGDFHYIKRSGISDNSSDKIYHFGHNADPIFIGTCGSTCSMVGYNINTKCHTGFTCSYDAKKKLGYTESVLNHRIEYIIKNVVPQWENDFPECIKDTECVECEKWDFK